MKGPFAAQVSFSLHLHCQFVSVCRNDSVVQALRRALSGRVKHACKCCDREEQRACLQVDKPVL